MFDKYMNRFYKYYSRRFDRTVLVPQTCFICKCSVLKLIGYNHDFLESNIFRCAECGFIFTYPTPITDELSSKYQEEYRKIRIEEPTQEYILQANKRAQAQKNFIQNNMESITDNAKILEIGCAAGSLLMQFQCETNNLFGFEPDLAMSHFAKKMLGTSSTIWNNIFNIDQAKENKYDLIMASHVLEHVPNPNQFIKDLISILSEKGHIFFEVPNESVLSVNEQSSHCLKGLMHLWFFQPTPLIRMIENAGGKIINIASYGPSIKYFSHFPVSQRGLKMKLLWKIGYLLHKLSFGKLYRELLSSSLITADSLNQIAEEEGIWIRVLFVKGN